MNLRKEARGRECQIRIPGICVSDGPFGDNASTVLCHFPALSMGGKSSDFIGAWGCYNCHQCVDGHAKSGFDKDTIRRWFMDGIIRTQQILVAEGKIRACKPD